MLLDENHRLMRRAIEEIWNDGDLDLADRLFAPGYVNHGGLIPDLVRGPEAIKVSVVLYRRAFPQFRLTVIDLFAQEQSVALRWAAHRAPARDPSNGALDDKPGPLFGMTIGRVSEGQIVESWTCWESGGAGDAAMQRDLFALARSA